MVDRSCLFSAFKLSLQSGKEAFSFCYCFLSFGVLPPLKILLKARFSSITSPILNIIFLDIILVAVGQFILHPALSSDFHIIGLLGFFAVHPRLQFECTLFLKQLCI